MQNSSMISPVAMMNIIKRIEDALWAQDFVKDYHDITRYLSRWKEHAYISTDSSGEPLIREALAKMSDELLFQIAVDLGLEIPGLLYSVAEIKGILDNRYQNVGQKFEDACKEVYTKPSVAILMANSALELLIKEICKDESIKSCDPKATLFKLTEHILKQFKFFPDNKLNTNIRNMGSGLLTATQAIEAIRSNNTEGHGTLDEIISDPLYAVFVVNNVASIGLFLLNYYEKHYKPQQKETTSESIFDEEIPF